MAIDDLVERALSGDLLAADELDTRADRARSARDSDQLNQILGPIALRAAAGEATARELLAGLVDSNSLCDPGIRRVFVDQRRVDDARQEALLALIEGVKTFTGQSRFTTWLFTVSNNAAKQMLRTESRSDRRHERAVASAATAPSARRLSSMIIERARLERAIDELPEEFRRVVVLRELHDRPYDEIASELDIAIGTVKSRLRRGRERVAAQLADEL